MLLYVGNSSSLTLLYLNNSYPCQVNPGDDVARIFADLVASRIAYAAEHVLEHVTDPAVAREQLQAMRHVEHQLRTQPLPNPTGFGG